MKINTIETPRLLIRGFTRDDALLNDIDKIHTTEMGIDRIKKNLKINVDDVVEYCTKIINNPNCDITRKGKNYYCQLNNEIITVNAYSYTIITAHLVK